MANSETVVSDDDLLNSAQNVKRKLDGYASRIRVQRVPYEL